MQAGGYGSAGEQPERPVVGTQETEWRSIAAAFSIPFPRFPKSEKLALMQLGYLRAVPQRIYLAVP